LTIFNPQIVLSSCRHEGGQLGKGIILSIGGMGAITQAMASAAVEHGVHIDVCSEVREVLVESDHATGIVLKDGTAVRARAVIANVNPQYLFQTLVPRDAAPLAVTARMKAWKAGSGTFRMNVALSKLPNFSVHHWLRANRQCASIAGS
jgi:phytoene dehydrogenase-like protein